MATACFVCGHEIFDPGRRNDPTRQVEEFRLAIYEDGRGGYVSGVGAKTNLPRFNWIVPLDYDEHWADVNATTVEEVKMARLATNARYGYPVHAACWDIAQRVVAPNEIDHSALCGLLDSLPTMPGHGCPNWGHNYGGVLPAYGTDEEQDDELLLVRLISHPEPDDPKHAPSGTITPEEILFGTAETPFPSPPTTEVDLVTGQDCFEKLPSEIRLLVAHNLQVSDVARLRLASRAFRFTFSDNQFWASRFAAERRWIFEASDWKRNARGSDLPLDWRLLYRHSNARNSTDLVRKRKLVWHLVEDIQEALVLRCFPTPVDFSTWLVPEHLKWKRATAEILGDDDRHSIFAKGCLLFHRQRVLIPEDIRKLEVFLARLGEEDFVTGLAYRPAQGGAVCLGYESDRSESVRIEGGHSGYEVAVGSQGVRGLRCVHKDGTETRRVGDWTDESETSYLLTDGPVMALEVGCDGCKIVSFAIGEPDLRPKSHSVWEPPQCQPKNISSGILDMLASGASESSER